MICNFYHALIQRETVIAGCGNIRAEKWKAFRQKKIRLLRPQMKNRMRSRTEKLLREWQQVRRPGAGCDHDCVSADPMSIFQHDSTDAILGFVERDELCAFA